MPRARLELKTSGLPQLEARVRTMAGMDTATLMPRLRAYLQRSTQARFQSETGPDGAKWAALKPRTIERKRQNKTKILTEHGYLRSRIRYQVTGPNKIEVGSDRVYAAAHQFGRDEANIPARRLLASSAVSWPMAVIVLLYEGAAAHAA